VAIGIFANFTSADVAREDFMHLHILILLALIVSTYGCATHQVTPVETRAVEAYPNRVILDGIAAAADPYDDAEKASRGFYQDVTREGFFPVQLIFKNDTKERVLVLRETIELSHPNGNIYRPVRSSVMYNAFENNKIAYALLGFGIFSYMSAEEANRKMESDYRDKELAEQVIILPGLRAGGFAYFQLPKGSTTKGSKLSLTAERLDNRQPVRLEFTL
jgi:hypothetical protein